MNKTSFYILIITLLINGCGNPILDKVKELNTPSLVLPSVTVYYSSGFDKKAKQAQKDLDKYISYFKRKIKVDISPVFLALLDEKDFMKVPFSCPYGLPNIQLNPPVVIFLPADGKGILATENKSILNTDTALARQIYMLGFETMDIAIDKSVDLIGFHELGHLISKKLGIRPKIKDIFWLEEFIASYIAFGYMYENEPSSAMLWQLIGKSVLSSWHPDTTDLAEMNPKDVKAYSWYQAKLIVKATEIYPQHKLGLITTLQLEKNKKDILHKLSELTNQDVSKW